MGEPGEVVLENARRKARAGLEAAGAGEAATVLGVDTDVALDGRLLGKPPDEAGARERLEALSGRTHEVLSGVVVARHRDRRRGPGRALGSALTEVTFERLDRRTIDLYVASGEWRDRAGALRDPGSRVDPDRIHPRRLLECRRPPGQDPDRAACPQTSCSVRQTPLNPKANI